jgi:hypothetical protein
MEAEVASVRVCRRSSFFYVSAILSPRSNDVARYIGKVGRRYENFSGSRARANLPIPAGLRDLLNLHSSSPAIIAFL